MLRNLLVWENRPAVGYIHRDLHQGRHGVDWRTGSLGKVFRKRVERFSPVLPFYTTVVSIQVMALSQRDAFSCQWSAGCAWKLKQGLTTLYFRG